MTRNDKGKKLRVVTTGADYGAKAAGATTVGLNSLGLCGFMISNPIILAIAGAVCAIFCCLGGYNEWRKPSKEELEEENNLEIKKMGRYIGEIKDEIKHDRATPCHAQRHIPNVGVYSTRMSMFGRNERRGPMDMSMEEEENIVVVESKSDFNMRRFRL